MIMKEKMMEPHASLCVHALGDIPFSFTMVQTHTLQGMENDHYIYCNVETVAIPNGCSTSIAPRECSPD